MISIFNRKNYWLLINIWNFFVFIFFSNHKISLRAKFRKKRTSQDEPFPRIDSVVRLAGELTNDAIYLSHLSRASHDWCAQFPFSVERRRRFNINDRIKELGTLLPKTNDPWVRISFLPFLLFPSLLPCRTFTSLSPSSHPYLPFFAVLLFFSLYPLHIPHGPLFPVRDPLRRVSPGQVLETRGFHLIWTGSPFFAPSRSLLPFAFLPLALHGRSLFLPLSRLCFPSFLPSKRNTSFDPGKWR